MSRTRPPCKRVVSTNQDGTVEGFLDLGIEVVTIYEALAEHFLCEEVLHLLVTDVSESGRPIDPCLLLPKHDDTFGVGLRKSAVPQNAVLPPAQLAGGAGVGARRILVRGTGNGG